REDLIRYATKGNGEIIAALLPVYEVGHNAQLAPYPFDPQKARHLLRDAGYPDGLSITLIAPEELEIQATVVSKMLEGVGLSVERQSLDAAAYNRKISVSSLDQPTEQQSWDIALVLHSDWPGIPVLTLYQQYMLGGPNDWGVEKPALQRLYEEVL